MVCGGDPQEEDIGLATVYLGLGTNLGDRVAALRRAVAALNGHGILVDQESAVYETEPVGVEDQPWFLNQVVRAKTNRSPHDVLAQCKRIETELGRRPAVRFGPRAIDIDILLYDQLTVDTSDLCIPHPRMRERRFVLIPLTELAMRVSDPRDGTPYADVLRGLDEEKKVTKSLSNES